MRLIDADKLKEDVLSWENCYNGYSDTYDKARIIGEIDEQTTVDAEPIRHGHWLSYEYGDYHWHKCSVCGVADKYIETVHRDGYPENDVECIRHYCPNCGAKMDEVEE